MYICFFSQQFFLFRNLPFRDTCTCAQLYVKGFHYTTVYNCEKQKQPNYLPVQKWFKYYGTSKLYIIIHIKPSNIYLHKSLQGTLLHEKQQVADWFIQWVKNCLSVCTLTYPQLCPSIGVGLVQEILERCKYWVYSLYMFTQACNTILINTFTKIELHPKIFFF